MFHCWQAQCIAFGKLLVQCFIDITQLQIEFCSTSLIEQLHGRDVLAESGAFLAYADCADPGLGDLGVHLLGSDRTRTNCQLVGNQDSFYKPWRLLVLTIRTNTPCVRLVELVQ